MIYEGTIAYVSVDENGIDRTKKEQYIIAEAVVFSDAESILYEEFEGQTDLDVIALKRSRIKEIANKRSHSDEKIFIATLVDVFLNEDGSEKEVKYSVAFFSKDINTANNFIQEYVQQGYNLEIKKIAETKFIDVVA